MIEWIQQVIQGVAARYDISAWAVDKTLRCESGNYQWAVIIGERTGQAGELGIAQLHPQGLLPVFYKLGYDSPFSIIQSIDFLGWAWSQGMANHWSCYNMLLAGRIPF